MGQIQNVPGPSQADFNALNDHIGNIPKFKYGTDSDNYEPGQYKAKVVTFTGTAFNTAPKVICQQRSPGTTVADVSHVVVDYVTITEFKYRVKNTSNVGLNIYVDWVAIGT